MAANNSGKEVGISAPIEVVSSKEEKTLLAWRALSRPYQKKDREFWTTVLATLGLVCVILFFVKEWLLIAAFLGLVFLYYVLTSVEPEVVDYRITNRGVYFPGGEDRLDWDLLHSFWILDKWGYPLVSMETWLKFPRVVSLVFNKEDKARLREIFLKYLPEVEIKKTFVDKLSNWVIKQLPLDTSAKPAKAKPVSKITSSK